MQRDMESYVDSLFDEIQKMQKQIDVLQASVLRHENELNERKPIVNAYTKNVLSKIDILKNIIEKNIGDPGEFISQHLIEVETIEEQIKKTGKISDKQFKILNDIYKKQKRI